MGIPAAFRWLSNKYPKIISPVVEDRPVVMEDGTEIPVDITRANPNGEELDNLYLDMNGIVHPCAHPEDKPAPKDEEEMMLEIFKYTDRVVNMVRPRKILMIAVDGVAPRAKMNQQRSRRFRSAQEAKEKEDDKQELIKLLKQQNGGHSVAESAEMVTKKAFDNNSITPGTPFMDTLASSLRYWSQYKLNTDPGWAKLKIIISDATVPGEGEHKIMNFVRSQRASPDYDPNTRHVIYGLDADLIMLGLATHEPHFRVLREDVFFQDGKARTCKLCGQRGHDAQNCRGETKEKTGEFDEKDTPVILKPFIWLHVSVLREYLAAELAIPDLPFRFDLERVIDDWIFMCCFVGNDFLPHLPALEIREHGIDTLTTIWKRNLPALGGYVTKDGHIDLERAQCILDGLAMQEDMIFKKRKEQEDRREASAKRRRLQNNGAARRDNRNDGKGLRSGHEDPARGLALHPIGSIPTAPLKAITHDMIVNRTGAGDANVANKSAASVLKERLKANRDAMAPEVGQNDSKNGSAHSAPEKRKISAVEGAEDSISNDQGKTTAADSTEMPADLVRLWEDGYADRYYQLKFHRAPGDTSFRKQVAHAYVEGLAWVLQYYFQGCPSWEWYYPYHYAPFAADFKEISEANVTFEKGIISRPFEQLMSVLPAASRDNLPDVFHSLMTNQDSDIIDFYPEEFEVDLNGKKMAWQGVALLPFIEMDRLLAAVQQKYPLLSDQDKKRNGVGRDVLLLSDSHESIYGEILTNFYSKKQGSNQFQLNSKTSDGLSGYVEKQEEYVPHGTLHYPLERKSMPDLDYDRSIRSVNYDMPRMAHDHKSMLLRGVKMPTPALTRSDIEVLRGKSSRGGYGGGNRGGRYDPGGHHQFRQNGWGRGQDSSSGRLQSNHHRHSDSRPPPQQHFQGRGGWHPPQPGSSGFGRGVPPPPPAAHQRGWGPQSFSGGGGQNYDFSQSYPPQGSQHYRGGWNGY
ncbi:hypothetical protein LLEC1_03397, partial [Akanthomyces lecanii]